MSLACLGVATQPFAQPVGITSMGPASGSELSPALERTLGDAIMEQGRRDPTYVADPDINQYLTEMGRKLASASPDRSTQQITVFPVKDPQINAFALPGGYIGINSGLVVASEDESELASVIAHEIGHVQQRHIARGMTQQSRSGHVMLAALAGALLAAIWPWAWQPSGRPRRLTSSWAFRARRNRKPTARGLRCCAGPVSIRAA
jgi:predicted Zn-dependent protease